MAGEIFIRVVVPTRELPDVFILGGYGPLVTGGGGSGGGSGSGSGTLLFQSEAISDGAQSVTLPQTPTAIKGVFINGLRQGPNEGQISGGHVLLPAGLNIVAGDHILIEYQ